MSVPMILKAAGIIFVCLGIHYGLGNFPWLLVFGAGLGMLFLS